MLRPIKVVFLFVYFVSLISSAYAQEPQIQDGITWITNTQNQTGSWGNADNSLNPLTTEYFASAEVLEALKVLNQDSSLPYQNGLLWLQAQTDDNTAYISRRIRGFANAGIDITTDLNTLLSYKNSDNGWGGYLKYTSSNFHTTLALQALKASNYTNQNTINSALNYLFSNQNSDGGFGFYQGDDSSIYMTALVSSTLQQFPQTTSIATAINKATTYLISYQNADGGWGTAGTGEGIGSAAYETALAYMALVGVTTDATVLGNAINYITSTQQANGSWDDDPYSTALALRALASVKANLTISSSDITFSNPAPTVGQPIIITANIKNTGPAQAPLTGSGQGVSVRFYDGDPAVGGLQIGETIISSISAFGNAATNITWTIPNASAHTIFITVDHLNTIDELSETDNVASKNLTSATLPDLSITSADINIFPPVPDPYIHIDVHVMVRNLGETDAINVPVDIYFGDPANGGVKLPGSGIVPLIPAGGVVDAGVTVAPALVTAGIKQIYVLVDPQNTIAESSKANNTAIKIVDVGSDTDLSTSYADITFSPANPKEGDIVTITSKVANNGLSRVSNVHVRLYLGDPSAGGTLIGSDIVLSQMVARSSSPVSTSWNTTGHAGNNKIFIVADPDNAIQELNEYNNTAYKTLKVASAASSQGPDLTLTASDISVTPSNPTAGQKLTVLATIRNIGNKEALAVPVEVSIINPADNTSLLIGTATMAIIPAGGSASVQISWDVYAFTGNNQIQVTVDPDNQVIELDETNNTASVPVTIAELQGPDILQDSIDLSGIVKDSQTRIVSGIVVFTLRNAGNQPTNLPFTIIAFEDRNNNLIFDPGTDAVMGQVSYPTNLAPGAAALVTLPISGTVQYIDSPVYLLLDNGNAVVETDEANNLNCLAVFTACRNSTVDAAVKSGASWLVNHQVNLDTQGTMKGWATTSVYYNTIAVRAYKSTGRTADTKYAAALNRLAQGQTPDGSWGGVDATAEAILALLYVGIDPTASSIKDGVSWIIRQQNSDGGWSSQIGATSTAVQTGKMLTALLKAGVSKNEQYIQRGAQWLINTQNSDGYWGDYPGLTSNYFLDTYPVIGLALATSLTDSRVLKAKAWYTTRLGNFECVTLYWLKMMIEIDPNNSSIMTWANSIQNYQRPDGGWRYYFVYPASSFDMTGNVLYVLGRLGISNTKVTNGISWIEKHINASSIGVEESYSIYLLDSALDALQAAKIGDTANLNAITKGRLALISNQNGDGSWSGPIPPPVSAHVYATSDVLFMLKYLSTPTSAEQTSATRATNFMLGAQLSDNGWPPMKGYYTISDLGSTESVLLSLLQSGLTATHTNVARGLAYLNSKQNGDGGFGNTSQTAIAAVIYKLAGAGYESRLGQTIAWLKVNQNPDGGWGPLLGYTSSIGNTFWGLFALSNNGEHGLEVARGVFFILAMQKEDGGWDDISSTASAVWALSIAKFTLGFNLDMAVERSSYCPGDVVRITATADKPSQNITLSGAIMLQGGASYQIPFTLSGDTFSSEFTVPADALPGAASVQAIGIATYGYGVSNKRFVIRNCTSLRPDLSLADSDITENSGDPLNLDTRTVSSTVKNLGDQDANNVTVNFYMNGVTPEGLIESKVITNLPAYTGSVTVNTTVSVTEDTVVYAIVDPDNAVAELNETNNVGTIVLTRKIADLGITNSDISLVPPGLIEGQAATVAAIVHNEGNIGASNVVVSFYDGDINYGGTLIGSVTKSYIDAGATALAEVSWNTMGQSGRNYVHVVVDHQGLIVESNENNNAALLPVDVTPPAKPDPAITSSDITFSTLNPQEGQPLAISTMLHNFGVSAAGIKVNVYDGSPSSGGVLLSTYTIAHIIPFGGQTEIAFAIDTVGLSGSHAFHIVLDPENAIDEINETNNTAWNSLTIGPSGISLGVSADKADYHSNDNVLITVTTGNLTELSRSGYLEVRITDLNANVVATVALNQALTLGPNGTVTTNYAWNTGQTFSGSYRIYTVFMENGNVRAKADAGISILKDMAITSKVTTDRIAYFPNQQAVITTSITSLSQNYIFENLTATIAITSPLSPPCQGGDGGGCQSQVIYTEIKPIAILLPGQITELKIYWNTSTNPPGAYPIALEVRDASGAIVSTAAATLTISDEIKPSKLLRGQVSVDRQSILQGEPVNVFYQVSNVGNVDLSQVNLSIRTVHVVNLSVYDTLTDQTALLKGSAYANAQQFNTGNYSAKDYLVVLMANISGVEETLAATYFRVEGAPSAPSLNAPSHASDVETTTPALSVNNASDPNEDRLTYEFELYLDVNLSTRIAASALLDEGASITSWQTPITLQENASYYWRARAFDGRLYGEWMTPAAFRVNVTNEPPTAPTLSAPVQNSFVDTLLPILTVNNASDPDSVNLTYNFVVASDPAFVNIVDQQIGIFSGQGSTSWQVTIPLQENSWYYWKSQADDWLIIGPWMTTARFFVNTSNEAPTAPVIIDPLNNSETASRDVIITVSNSTDPDSAIITYFFEADTALTFDSPDRVTSSSVQQGSNTTSWIAAGLKDNTFYYARAKASDGKAESPLSAVVGFFVNTANDAPTVPVLANPSNGAGVNNFSPVLTVHNAIDIDGDILTYDFELYADAALSSLAASAPTIQETPQITGWTVPVSLTENCTYFWRARAYDGQLYGPWMPAASFMVNTANDAPTAPNLNAPAQGNSLSTLTPTLSIHNAIDPDSDNLTYDFEVYAGTTPVRSMTAIPQNASGITSVALSPALSDNTTYQWRARAYDGDRYGAWMDMATFSIHLSSQNITSTIDFDPDTLNQKSKGNWVTVYIELPVGYNVANINISSLRMNGTIPAETWPYAIGDYDHDGIPDLMVKFDRNAVINLLPNGDKVKVTVTGAVGATTFEGVDTIRVMK